MENWATSLYIHWPFCALKCPYCDFNSHVAQSIDHERWRAAYVRALRTYAEMLPGRRISTIYFGGGTPSMMEPETAAAIIDTAQGLWRFSNDIEITLEANPTSVEADKFAAFRAAGVNRVSLGVQALSDKDLSFLGREHSAAEALQALAVAKDQFDRVSFDLIYARPEQSLGVWEAELRRGIDLAAGHMSLYQLTIERNTPFYMRHVKGDFSMPKEELAADFYVLTQEVMAGAGLPAYEVSNHAQAGQESAHNMAVWRYHDYIGIGPGAHGRVSLDGVKHATRGHSAPQIWLERVDEYGMGAHPFDALDLDEAITERLIMGLRTVEGVAAAEVEGVLDAKKVGQAVAEGWLVRADGRIAASRAGWLRMNALIDFIVA